VEGVEYRFQAAVKIRRALRDLGPGIVGEDGRKKEGRSDENGKGKTLHFFSWIR
jgi:hypothetical protein